ncbi:uncharacterized protein BJ171DRAFT_296002 [Polychytrium aggregatum]|uniref:uncharacterized protein n=1 Tax=Polychytrium aggregatum TaxID=110093 RepID=UPI0022FECBDB|nr:uncharacterized protein BJ171DRAFT_296002 [Polychytrium aggregatum]KAI9207365.1 hypothetical protein BJ171DRAFT_296002 [Polychytrium aggregatum]
MRLLRSARASIYIMSFLSLIFFSPSALISIASIVCALAATRSSIHQRLSLRSYQQTTTPVLFCELERALEPIRINSARLLPAGAFLFSFDLRPCTRDDVFCSLDAVSQCCKPEIGPLFAHLSFVFALDFFGALPSTTSHPWRLTVWSELHPTPFSFVGLIFCLAISRAHPGRGPCSSCIAFCCLFPSTAHASI